MGAVWIAVFMIFLVWSGIAPKDFMTWCLEVFPAVLGGVVLWVTRERFPLTGREIFAYGDTIYNPLGGAMPIWIIEHEEVRRDQQRKGVKQWWASYLEDDDFRFNMELEAHQVEYRCFCRHNKDRNDQAKYLFWIAKRLSSKMYGSMITLREAVSLIRKGR